MAKNAFERFIQRCGTVRKAANILRTSHQNVSSMRNGRTWVKHSYAKRVADYLWKEMNYKLDPLDLVSPLEKNKLKSLSLPFTQHAIKLINISISQVSCEAPKPNLNAKNTSLSSLRPIILDETQQLIANPNTYWLYQQQHKKTIPAWRVSLSDLLAKKYAPIELLQLLLICERGAIGIAAKKYIGHRQGQRSDLKLSRKLDKVIGRTDEWLAAVLGFGCKDIYRKVEKIQLLGSDALIDCVNNRILTISAAAPLTRFGHKKQQKILTLNKKEILAFSYQLKQRK